MANLKHRKRIKQGARFWNHWREINPTENIDLSGENLSLVDLEGVNLEKAKLFRN